MAEFVTCSQDSVVFWDNKSFSSKKSSQPFSGSGYHVASASWSSSNSKLMVAPKWGDSIVWCEPATDVSSWNTIWHRDSGHFTCGCLMSNSRYLLSGSSDGLLMLWDVKTRSSTKTFEGFTSPVTGVVSSSNDQLVLSGAQDGSLLLHTLSSSHALQHTITLSHTDMEPQAAITRLRFSVMDRALAASTNETGSVCLWSVESQRLLHQFTSSHTGSATDLCFAHSNNKLLVSVGQDSKIHFLDIQQRKEVMLVTTPSPLTSVAILRDGYTIVAGGVDGKLYVYELRAMKSPKHSISAHQGAITCITEQNTAKSSRGSSRGSTHSSKKSAKDSSRQSVLTSADDSPDVGGTPGTSQGTHHDSTISSLPPTDTPQPSQPPLLTPHPSASSSSSQLPSLPVVTQAPTSGPSAVHQTPFAAPRAPSGMQWAQFFTPAQSSGDKDSTGIFSPVESTPHPVLVGGSSDGNSTSGGSKATAAIPPTQRPQQTDGRPPQDVRGYPVMSTFIASTPATQPPLGMSGIFSPLDAPTPATLTLARPAVGGWSTVPRHVPFATPSATTPALSGVSAVRPPPNLIAGHSENTSALPPPPTSSSLHTQHTLTSTTDTTSAPPQSSLSPQSSSFTGSSASQPVTSTTPPAAEPRGTSVEGIGTVPTAFGQLPQRSTSQPEASIHMQYLEKLIRDSNEELRYATHRDIRALGLDMFRQFLILQQQFGSAISVLNEKIERLSEENRHLQEQLHQYTPKY